MVYVVYTGLRKPLNKLDKKFGVYTGIRGNRIPLKKGQKTIPEKRIFSNLDEARKCSNFFKKPIYEVREITIHKVRKVK